MIFSKKAAKVLAFIMGTAFVLTSCSSGSDIPVSQQTENQALIIGTSQLGGVFSPFFAVSGYDSQIAELTAVTLLGKDRNGLPADGGAVYSEPVMVEDDQGGVEKTIYTFRLKDNLKFSDGTEATADDVVFSFKVLCDPSYDGPFTISALPIEGINEYRYDDVNYQQNLEEIQKQAQDIEKDEVLAYIRKCAENDYETYGPEEVASYTGFENKEGLAGDGLKEALIQAYYDIEKDSYFEYYIEGAKEDKLKVLEQKYVKDRLSLGGVTVSQISGIRKIDEKTVEVTLLGVNAPAVWELGSLPIAPESYYGQNYKKGDLAGVKEKNGAPFGAGPYIFKEYANNVVTYEANPYYFKGEPAVKELKVQVISPASQLEAVIQGQADIANPIPSADIIKRAVSAKIHYELIDSNSYGYIGISADRIPDINERRAILSLINKEPAVLSYYGQTAQVIERPISSSSWACPDNPAPVYRYDPSKALAYFEKAGWTQEEKNGAKILVKDGKQLTIKAAVDGGGRMDHPSAPILTQMKIDIEKLGGKMEINDCDINVLSEGLANREWDIWAASWQLETDPDMSAKYMTGSMLNYYGLADDTIDRLLTEGKNTTDIQQRKKIYENCLNQIMLRAVEMPVYQRKDMFVYGNVVDLSSLPEHMTIFYNHMNEIHTLRLLSK